MSGRRKGLIGAVAASVPLGAAAVIASVIFTGGDGSADPSDPVQIALGRDVYVQSCAACHGDKLEGQPNWRQRGPSGRLPAPPHDETGHTWHHPDQVLFEMTKYGIGRFAGESYKSDMPVFDGILSDAEISAALSYIKSRWPAKFLAMQERTNR